MKLRCPLQTEPVLVHLTWQPTLLCPSNPFMSRNLFGWNINPPRACTSQYSLNIFRTATPHCVLSLRNKFFFSHYDFHSFLPIPSHQTVQVVPMDDLPVDPGGNPSDQPTPRAPAVVANEDGLMFPGFGIDAILDNLDDAGCKMLLQQESSARQMSKDRRVLNNLVVIGRTVIACRALVNSADFCEMVAESSGISYNKTTRAAAVENILQAYVHARSLVVPSGRPSPNSFRSALTIGFDELVALRREYLQSIGVGPADLAALQASWKQLLKSRISGSFLENKSNETLVDDCK